MKRLISSATLRILIWVGSLSLLSACGPGELAPTLPPVLKTAVALPSATTLATKTPPPQPAATLPITATPLAPSPPSLPQTSQPGQQTVQIFLIALEDNGQSGKKIGCDDSVIPVPVTITPTLGVLRAALEELLSVEDIYYGVTGLYNALHQSELVLDSVSIVQGKATIHLSGTFMLSGVCDNPRVEAQLEETALQFPTVSQVSVFVNGKPLEEVLSLR